MKKTLLTLVAGASIGAGTVVTLPDGTTATTEMPTASQIYTEEFVSSLKLVSSADGVVARYIVSKTSTIEGVAAYTESGESQDQESVFDAVSDVAKTTCDDTPNCSFVSMIGARSVGVVTTADLKGYGNLVLTDDIPQLDELKKQILEKE